MQKLMDKNGKQVNVIVDEEVETYNIRRYRTAAYEIVLKSKHGSDDAIQKFLNMLSKQNKLGGYKIPAEEWKGRKEGFITKKMKPLGPRPSGTELEESFKELYNAIFPEKQEKKN